MARVIALALLFGAVAGCGGAVAGTSPSRSTRGSSSVLTAAEIAKTNAPDALRAIELARPQWLSTRTTGFGVSHERVQVYLEGSRQGELPALQQMSVSMIREIQFLDARQATTRFGTGHGAGAILVFIVQ